MTTLKIEERPLMADKREGKVFARPAKVRILPLLRALYLPIGVISGLLISTFPLSALVLYVIALLLFGK